MDFILSRAKAFVGALIPALAATVFSVIETQFGFAIDDATKIAIISAVTGLLVYQVPNQKA